MAQAFTRDPQDGARLIGFLEDAERSVVIELLHQTSVLLSDGSENGDADPTLSPEDELFASLSRSTAERAAPTDPALRRLLPDGVKGDAEAASEFRRFTEASLRERKLTNIETAMRALERGFVDDERAAALADAEYERAAQGGGDAALDDAEPTDASREIILTESEARALMVALTDVRLVLAERLGVHTDEDAEALTAKVEQGEPPSSPEGLMAVYYDFLTWLSESVTLAVLRKT